MESLGLDIKFLMAQLINFGLFAFVFSKFMYKPFKAYLAEQRKDEAEKDRLLHDLQAQEVTLGEKEKEVLAAARKQATQIVKEAEATAEKKHAEIVEAAQKEAQALKKKAQKEASESEAKMYDELRTKVVHTSEVMTENVLKDFLTEAHQKDILTKVFDKLKTAKVYEN